MVALIGSDPAQAAGQCAATHQYTAGKTLHEPETQPATQNFGILTTARGCLEKCHALRKERLKEGKEKFGKMDYSCTYNGKLLNSIQQKMY